LTIASSSPRSRSGTSSAVVGLGERRIAELSSAIAGAVVSNGSVSYVDGERWG
jgi:hypothetical protein